MEDGLVHPFWLLGLEEREGYESPEAQHMKTLIRDIGALSSTLRGKMQASFYHLGIILVIQQHRWYSHPILRRRC